MHLLNSKKEIQFQSILEVFYPFSREIYETCLIIICMLGGQLAALHILYNIEYDSEGVRRGGKDEPKGLESKDLTFSIYFSLLLGRGYLSN